MRAATLVFAVTLALAPHAHAEGEALALWQAWQERARAGGLTLEAGTVAQSGETLDLARIRLGNGDGTLATLGAMTLTGTGAGAVEITLPATVPLSFERPGPDGTLRRAAFTLASEDLRLRHETPQRPGPSTFTAATAMLSLDSLEGFDMPADTAFRAALTDAAGSFDPDRAVLELEAAGLVTDSAATDLSADRRVSSSSHSERVTLALSTLPGPTPADPPAGVTLRLQSGPTSTKTETRTPGTAPLRVSSTQEAAHLSLTATDTRADYQAEFDAMALRLDGPGIPLGEIAADIAAGAVGLSLPLAAGPVSQPAELRLSLADVTLDDAVWAKLDPSGALPRDPAQLTVALNGEILVSDDPETDGEAAATATPMLPRALQIDTFSLTYGDLSLSAEGGVTFPPATGTDLPDPARPVGTVILDAAGVLPLLQRLVGAGLLAPEQAMGAQMMMGIFAQQDEDGNLSTEVESRPDGSLYVNGNRMR